MACHVSKLLVRHMPVSRDNCQYFSWCGRQELKWNLNLGPVVFNAIRAIHATTPILILGGQYHSIQWYARNWGLCPGHTHIRDCSAYHGCNNVLIWSLDETCDQCNLTKGPCHWKAAVTWKQLVCPLKSGGLMGFNVFAGWLSVYHTIDPMLPCDLWIRCQAGQKG